MVLSSTISNLGGIDGDLLPPILMTLTNFQDCFDLDSSGA